MTTSLYYKPGACSLAVHILLELIGKPYQLIKADFNSTQFKQLNPALEVPTLVVDTHVMTQCASILQFLALNNPQINLNQQADAGISYEQTRWACFLTGDLHPAFFPVFSPQRYIVSGTPDELTRIKKSSLLLVRKKLAVLEQQLTQQKYFVNDKLSYVDIYSIPMFRWAKYQLENQLADFPHIQAHYEMMSNMAAAQTALKAEGLEA